MLSLDPEVAGGERAAARARLLQAAKLQPTALTVEYEVAAAQLCGAPADGAAAEAPGGAGAEGALAAAMSRRSSLQADGALAAARSAAVAAAAALAERPRAPAGLRCPGAAALRQLHDAAPLADGAAAAAAPADGAVQACAFTHRCILELSSPEAELPGAVVLVQLLGPFAAVAGRPTSLCWRLERSGAAPPGDRRAARLHFEVGAEDDGWRPAGRRGGAVTLEAHDGALATVEAAWVPLGAGALPVPCLRLLDVPSQELFDVGSGGANYVQVASA